MNNKKRLNKTITRTENQNLNRIRLATSINKQLTRKLKFLVIYMFKSMIGSSHVGILFFEDV